MSSADPTAQSIARPESRRKLTIVVPCFNERATILDVVERVKRVPIDKFILVVENCSNDGTRELLRSVCRDERALGQRTRPMLGGPRIPGQRWMDGDGFAVLLQPTNLRKGTSLKTGLALANSEYIICQDADLEYDPDDIVRLLAHAESTQSAAVFGSRVLNGRQSGYSAFDLGRLALSKTFQVIYNSHVTDVATCYKLMRTDVARSLNMEASGFDLDFEIAAKLLMQRYAISELPVSYRPRTHAHGKKIRWHDGFAALWTLVKLRCRREREG